jgi:hypothetical protein
MTIQPKRQSTTSKITANLVRLITAHCSNGDGVIVRFKGKEYGVIEFNPFNGKFMTIEGCYLIPALCTVRKGLPSAWGRQALLQAA